MTRLDPLRATTATLLRKGVFVHPTSYVETTEIGEGTRVWAFTHVMDGVRIGMNCNIGEHCYLETGCVLEDNVTVKNGSMIWEGVTIQDGVFVGPGVSFTNDLHPRSPRLDHVAERYSTQEWLVPTLVEEGATLGAGAVILPGATIGRYAMVGAGAVVTRPVSPHQLVLGNPARPRGWVCLCGATLRGGKQGLRCWGCGLHYLLGKDGIERLPGSGDLSAFYVISGNGRED